MPAEGWLGWLDRTLPVRALGRHLLPWAEASLALIVPAGALTFHPPARPRGQPGMPPNCC